MKNSTVPLILLVSLVIAHLSIPTKKTRQQGPIAQSSRKISHYSKKEIQREAVSYFLQEKSSRSIVSTKQLLNGSQRFAKNLRHLLKRVPALGGAFKNAKEMIEKVIDRVVFLPNQQGRKGGLAMYVRKGNRDVLIVFAPTLTVASFAMVLAHETIHAYDNQQGHTGHTTWAEARGAIVSFMTLLAVLKRMQRQHGHTKARINYLLTKKCERIVLANYLITGKAQMRMQRFSSNKEAKVFKGSNSVAMYPTIATLMAIPKAPKPVSANTYPAHGLVWLFQDKLKQEARTWLAKNGKVKKSISSLFRDEQVAELSGTSTVESLLEYLKALGYRKQEYSTPKTAAEVKALLSRAKRQVQKMVQLPARAIARIVQGVCRRAAGGKRR